MNERATLVDWHDMVKLSTRGQTCPSATAAATNPNELAGRKCIKIEVMETSRRKRVASGTCVGGNEKKCLFLVQRRP
jgi:hypothetical protein